MFYRENDFREKPLGEIPKDWTFEKMGNICVKITDGTHKTPNYLNQGVPFISTQNLTPFRKDFDFSSYHKYISPKEHRELIKRCNPKKGDILISKCGTIGRTKLVDVDYEFSIFVGVALLKIKNELVTGEYLEQLLNYEPLRTRMEILSPGSTRKTLTIGAIDKLHIPLPSLEEQNKIVEVLAVVDLAVGKVDEVIAKTERLKKGLMQELLTKGIGHKEFKDTNIGKIPKEWQVVKLGEVCDQRSEIVQPSGEGKNKFIGLKHITSGETTIQSYDLDTDVKSSKFRFYARDILYGKLRPYLDKAVLVDFNGICSTDLLALTAQNGKALEKFLVYVTHSNGFIRHANSTTSGTNHPRTSWKAISKFKFGLPPLPEQQKIAEILSSVDRKLELERKEKAKLERIKRGLMDLLLTGKVRVKVAN